MKSTRTVVVLIAMCAASLGAGVVAGKLAGRSTARPEPVRIEKAGLADELALSPEQREQMRRIWVHARDRAGDCAQQAQAAQIDQDHELAALLTDQQRVKFNALTQKTLQRVNELETQRKQLVQDAISQTEAMLTDSQRAAYREIVRSRLPSLSGMGDTDLTPAAK